MNNMGDMGGMMGGSCKISMLWNWNTIDACFISDSWQITSHGMFAGCCIGVIFLVMALEFLRRAGKEYDRFIMAEHMKKHSLISESSSESALTGKNCTVVSSNSSTTMRRVPKFRPSILQQAMRALLHMLQFAVAYFIMLLAMYYNGYFIICIFIGAYLGSFIFQWETFNIGDNGRTSAGEEATVCCG